MVSHNVPLGDHGGSDTQTSSLILISGRTFDPRSITTPEQSRPSTSGSSRCVCFYKDNTNLNLKKTINDFNHLVYYCFL